MKKVDYIFITNSTGGIKTFEENLTNLLCKNKKIYFYDKSLNKKNTLNKKIYFRNLNPLKETFKIKNDLLKKINTKEKVSFIISNSTILVFFFVFIKKKFPNSKIIFFRHSHIYNFSILNIFTEIISSIMTLKVSHTVYVSKFTKQWWFSKFKFLRNTKSSIIHNFSNEKIIFKKKDLKKNFSIGYVGRLNKEKGISKFLNYAAKTNLQNINFKIFGDGPLKKLIPKSKKVFYFGEKNRKFIYRNIDILLITSPIENSPFTLIEARCYGIPTINLADGGVIELISNFKNGINLENNSEAKKIDKMIGKIIINYKKYQKNCILSAKKNNSIKQMKRIKNIIN